MTETNILEKAVVSLANECDGAYILDDRGFNRFDSRLGRQLAYKPFHLWTQNQKVSAHSMLEKYRKQLLNYGIIYSDIPKPESETPLQNKPKSSISLSPDSKNFVIKFAYNTNLVNAIRSIKGRKWNAKEKYWSVNSGFTESYSELLDFGKLNKFEIESKVHEFISDKSKEVEKQIESSKATDADIEINGLGGVLRPFQRAGVAYANKYKSVFIADEMGCLSGDTLILVNRGGGSRRCTLEDVYIRFNNLSNNKRHNWDTTIDSFTRSLSLDKKNFRLNRIKKVIYKGIKSVYMLKTEDHFIKATDDHVFFTQNGEKELKNLNIGEYLYTNGIDICPVCGTDKNLVVYKYAKFKGYCKRCVYKHKRDNFVRSTSSCGESIDKDGYVIVTRNLTYHPHERSDGVYKHRLVYEAYLNGIPYKDWLDAIKYNQFIKDSIFLTSDICIHHKDGHKTNNLLSNLEAMTHAAHQKIHGNYMNFGKFFVPKLQCIESIVYVGKEKVYDIVMEDPNRNFIANGIVVHNCGKTVQALATMQVTSSYPALILCPASLKYNWERETMKWLPGKSVQVLSSKDTLSDTDITILNYDIVKKHFDNLKKRKYQIIIMDESHYLKSSKSIRTKFTSKLASKIPYKLALTGTPILNRPQELVSQLGILGRLDEFGGYWNFAKRYCLPENAPIFMSDFTEKAINKIKIGDKIIGWGRIASKWRRGVNKGLPNRKLCETQVVDILKRESILQKVILEDSTEIICTPDHRWLTGRGECGIEDIEYSIARVGHNKRGRGAASKIVRIMGNATPFYDIDSSDYALGYLIGIFRGDGSVVKTIQEKIHPFKNSVRRGTKSHLVCIGVNDYEIIDRIKKYLNMFGVPFREYKEGELNRISMSSKLQYEFFLNKQPNTKAWWAGFLGGIYDAEGSGRIISQSSDINKPTYQLIERALKKFKIKYTKFDDRFSIGGRRKEFLRFWKIASPVLIRKLKSHIFNYGGRFLMEKLRVKKIIPIKGTHTVYTLTTTTGNYIAYGLGSKNCNAKMTQWGWDLSGSSNLDELNNKLRGTCFIRRTKSEVLKELPAKQRVIIPVELSNMKTYEKAELDIVSWLGNKAQNESEFLESINHLPQHEQIQLKRSEKRNAVRKAESAEHLVRIEALKQLAVQGKMKTVKDWVGSFLETGEKLVIFAHHVQIQKDLLDMFSGSAQILAEDSPELRQENVDKFQENSKCKLMIASLQAGGVGITLTAASNVLFLELGWNPATMSQAEDRCHRIGQTDSVTAYYMLGKDTIDEDIYELIEEKRGVVDEAIEDIISSYSTKDKSILNSVTDKLMQKVNDL